ncbi:hypothetical protein EYF80_067948 [Liparis tanakae]|uniref:Uncharacterized protein n=1 Tax=Liparis tanakae TaxID=230148 RepID=A0A4Z2E0B6_9TELE|nr:hypothetical protein EYF80_067948 [Liparis tanakae]
MLHLRVPFCEEGTLRWWTSCDVQHHLRVPSPRSRLRSGRLVPVRALLLCADCPLVVSLGAYPPPLYERFH